MAHKAEPLIRRHDRNHFNGWVVAVKRGDRRWYKYFSDREIGSAAALELARAFRDRLTAKLSPPVKIKRQYALNKTGVVGVALVRETSRSGTPTDRYVVSVPLVGGRRGNTSFSLAKYGQAAAFRMAVRARREAVARFIREQRSIERCRSRREVLEA